MEKEEKLPIDVLVGGPKKFPDGKALKAEVVKIFQKMVEVDKDPGKETGQSGG